MTFFAACTVAEYEACVNSDPCNVNVSPECAKLATCAAAAQPPSNFTPAAGSDICSKENCARCFDATGKQIYTCDVELLRFAAGVETSSSYYCSRIDCDALNLNPGQCLYKGIETNSIDAYCSVVVTP
jgi:hypothetical protein